MLSELKEVQNILEKSDDIEDAKSTLEQGIQVLLHHQIIYSDTHTVPKKVFDFILTHQSFYEKYFAAAGFKMMYDPKTKMIALSHERSAEKIYGIRLNRLKKDETYSRLVLKYMYIDGFRSGDMDTYGRVGGSFTDFLNLYRSLTGEEPPNSRQLKERIFKNIQTKGAIRFSDDTITIFPGINVLVSDKILEDFVTTQSETE